MIDCAKVLIPVMFCVCAAFGDGRALIYPTVVFSGSNMVADARWEYPSGDSVCFTAEQRVGGPFSDDAPAWNLRMTAPHGSYWRHRVKVGKNRVYLMGAWMQVDNTHVAIRGYGKDPSDGHGIDKRVYYYSGFNSYLTPYFSPRTLRRLASDPCEWRLLYRLVEYPDGLARGDAVMAVGIYIATGSMTFADPFFIDVTDIKDRTLTVDVSGSRPFRSVSVVSVGNGDEVWRRNFKDPVKEFKAVVPADRADYTQGLEDDFINGYSLVVTYVDGSVKVTHSPQENSFTKRK